MKTLNVVEFGAYIRELRKKQGRTLSDVSEISGVSHPYLSQIENGKLKKLPSMEILNKLGRIPFPLGVTTHKLMIKAGYYNENETRSLLEAESNQMLYDSNRGFIKGPIYSFFEVVLMILCAALNGFLVAMLIYK